MGSKWIHYSSPSVDTPQPPWIYNAEQASESTVITPTDITACLRFDLSTSYMACVADFRLLKTEMRK